MLIKSNTSGKINKMITGTIFSSEVVFVKEFLQNAQRANASMVDIQVADSIIVFADNGKGCKKPKNLFTLDFSDWGNSGTTEGFGIGFWSCLAIKGLISIKVRSYNWQAEILIENLINNKLDIDLKDNLEIVQGFRVELYVNNLDLRRVNQIEEEINNTAKYLKFTTMCNGTFIEKVDIFSSVDGDFVKHIDNRYFTARLSIDEFKYSNNGVPTLFYDNRKVCNLYDAEYVHGIIEAKRGKVDFKEPDRTDYIWNQKYKDFRSKLKNEIKFLYIDFLKSNPSKAILDKYAEAIDFYLDVKDYEKYLNFNALFKCLETSNTADALDNVNTTEDVSLFDDMYIEDAISITYDEQDFSTDKGEQVFIREIQNEFSMDNYSVTNKKIASLNKECFDIIIPLKDDSSKIFKRELMKKNKIAWVLKDEIASYKDEISKAQYIGIQVIELDNILYGNIFKKYNKMHISEFTNCFNETFEFKNIHLKNSKEIRVIENLIPICKKYNLPFNTFVIGDCEIKRSIEYKGKTVYKKKTKNTKDKIEVYAVIHNDLIILDRTALCLSKFKLPKQGSFGINDLKFIYFITNTIAHELAHYLYNTKDNTIEQYNHEIKLQEEITNLYI